MPEYFKGNCPMHSWKPYTVAGLSLDLTVSF